MAGPSEEFKRGYKGDDSQCLWFPSKVDWWLGIILALLPVVSLGVLLTSLVSEDPAELVSAVISCAVTAGIYGLLVFPMRYGIAEDDLVVRYGVVRHRIRLERIQEVAPTHNPLSSPALSLDRLAIRTGSGLFAETMISPADREAFLATLAMRAGLHRDGDRLVRIAHTRDAGSYRHTRTS